MTIRNEEITLELNVYDEHENLNVYWNTKLNNTLIDEHVNAV